MTKSSAPQLHEKQLKVLNSNARFKVLCWGRRTGKTFFCSETMIGMAISRASKICYIANTQEQSRDIIWETLKNRVAEFATEIREARLEIVLPTQDGGRSTIKLSSWEKVNKLRGLSFDLLVLDEVRDMRNFKAEYDNILRPTLTDREGRAIFISTPNGKDHFAELCEKAKKSDNWGYFHATSHDNPHLPASEIEEAKKEMSQTAFEQEYMAEFVKIEGLIYKEYHPTRNLIYDDKETLLTKLHNFGNFEKIIGIDFGYTNPMAIITIYYIPSERRYYIVDEFYETGKTVEDVKDYLIGKNAHHVCGDPSAPDRIKQLQDFGINMRNVERGKDSVKGGIEVVRSALLQSRLKVHKSCENVQYEFNRYKFLEGKDTIRKVDDHAMDAIRYAITWYDRFAQGGTSGYANDLRKMAWRRSMQDHTAI